MKSKKKLKCFSKLDVIKIKKLDSILLYTYFMYPLNNCGFDNLNELYFPYVYELF